ncbi:MAG TPA: nitroreductase family protein [Kofleriaceae bacterium]|nr:nitroreductase family protein [Kofleriaceae bacterium]
MRGAAACALQAPSSHNTQPWRMRLRGDRLELLLDRSRQLEVIDPDGRQLAISVGCALFNARLAVRNAGYLEHVETYPDAAEPELAARLGLGLVRTPIDDDRAMLAAVPRRATNRRPFHDRPVGPELADELARAARRERAWLHRLSPDGKHALADLVAEADRRQYADPDFRDELARWLAGAGSRRKDGIPFAEKEYGSPLPFTVARRLRTLDLGESFGELEQALIEGSPLVVVLAAQRDEPIDWLDAGQALQAVLLRATMRDLSASFLNQVLEEPDLREQVQALIGVSAVPQAVLRLGYADPVSRLAPRRDLDDVLDEE